MHLSVSKTYRQVFVQTVISSVNSISSKTNTMIQHLKLNLKIGVASEEIKTVSLEPQVCNNPKSEETMVHTSNQTLIEQC